MFDEEGCLDIFERFEIDTGLPKHQREVPAQNTLGDSDSEMMSEGMFIRSRRGRVRFSPNTLVVSGDSGVKYAQPVAPKLTFLQRWVVRLLSWVSPEDRRLVLRPLNDPEQTPEITVREFFTSVKNGAAELEVVDGRVRGYEAALEKAQRTGQTALLERLEAGIASVRSETQLIAMGLTKVLSEDTLVEFVKKSPKGLRLDWMKNFTRVIPDEVLAKKVACDERHIFDNYVILHYDPDGKSWAETQADRDRRKDPILFGVLEGKRQLYFVGDWIDEFCDLTLDQIADVLARDATVPLDPEAYA